MMTAKDPAPGTATPGSVFRHEYGDSANFMTPRIHKRGWLADHLGRFAWELSSGPGIEPGSTIWGLTIVECWTDDRGKVATDRRCDLSGCHGSKAAAMRRRDELAEELRQPAPSDAS